jgi:hypothetical protein
MGNRHGGFSFGSWHSDHEHHGFWGLFHGIHDVLLGTTGNDTVDGTDKSELIIGLKGDDELFGKAGNDWLKGGPDDDQLFGGSGNDILAGGIGNDILDGNEGGDKVFGGAGDDVAVYTLAEHTGSDACGNVVRDFYDGGKGHDVLRLILTADELKSDAVQADIAAFEDFLKEDANGCGRQGEVFEFKSFNLAVRNFEELQIPDSNTPPIAVDDAYIVQKGTPFEVSAAEGVLANDTDVEDDMLFARLFVDATHPGPRHAESFELREDGSFSYEPKGGFFGEDGFYYQADDGDLSNIAYVELDVTNPFPPPPPLPFEVDGLLA